MGKISEYQQQQLASEAVGTPGIDQSGEILGKSIEVSSDQLIQRQQHLDKIQYTNAYYDYQNQDELARVELQQQYRSQPEEFNKAYAAKSSELLTTFREQLPERQRANFELLASRRRATIEPSNLRWTFDQQNRLALNRVEEGGAMLSLSAQTWQGAEGYLAGISDYRKRFKETDAPLLDDPTSAEKKYLGNATRMYVASMLDNNTGNAIQLRRDFEENEDFKKEVVSALGVQGFNTAYAAAKKQVASLMSEQAFDMLKDFSYDEAAMGKVSAIFESPAGLAVGKAQNDVIIAENALESILRDPNAKEYGAQIEVMKKEVEQSRIMLEIATKRDRTTVQTDFTVLSDLQQKVFSVAAGLSTPKELSTLAADVKKENSKDTRASLANFIGPIGHLIKVGPQGDLKANKSYSQHLQDLYDVKGEILAKRNEGLINDKDANSLLKKIAAPLASLNEFDRIQGGNSNFVQAYTAFDRHAKNATLRIPRGTPASKVRQARDIIRTRMVSQYAEKMHELQSTAASMGEAGIEFGRKGNENLIRLIINDFNQAMDPNQYPGLKKGDIVSVNGKAVPFAGYNASNGRSVHETPKGLDDSLGNV